MFQVERGSLRELNISDCHSASLTAKTVLNLAKVPSLATLHLRLDHFKWMELSLRFLGAEFLPSKSVRTLVIQYGSSLLNLPLERNGVNLVRTVFPEVQSYRIMDIEDTHIQHISGNVDDKNVQAIFDDRIHAGSVRKCRDLAVPHDFFSNAKSILIEILTNPKLEPGMEFGNLQDLFIRKEMFSIEFQLLHDLLRACPSIKKFSVEATSLQHYDEAEFLSLFTQTPHLRALEHFSLSFRTSCSITMALLSLLLDSCPRLEHVGNLLTWAVTPSDMSTLARRGKVAMFASRNHWSLPWRAEDGSLYEMSNTPAVSSGDLFDNF